MESNFPTTVKEEAPVTNELVVMVSRCWFPTGPVERQGGNLKFTELKSSHIKDWQFPRRAQSGLYDASGYRMEPVVHGFEAMRRGQ
ncbi:hypothetical protein Vi05172_g2808 [Venturia inaequalis]|nr:hypothetical protein Vi05172_g2808 [Venturia inaequalis]